MDSGLGLLKNQNRLATSQGAPSCPMPAVKATRAQGSSSVDHQGGRGDGE
jgi:hypothetical protein